MDHPNDDYIGGTGGQAQGPPIPPEVFSTELAGESEQGGSLSTGGSTAPDAADGQKPVADMNREDLEAELGDDVPTEGSGANGNVVVEDLRSALAKKREAAEG